MPFLDRDTLNDLLTKGDVVHASTCVADLDYDLEGGGILTVTFQQRGTYEYHNVPVDVFVDFALSGSPGKFFNYYVRDKYSYERVG